MKDNRAIQILAGVVILGSGILVYLTLGGRSAPPFNPRPHQALGVILAQQALRLVKSGEGITVITRDTAAFKSPASEVSLAAFRKTLAKAGVKIAAVHALELDPLRPVEVPAGDFLELIRNASRGSVIVSFMGPPLLSESQRRQITDIKPSVVALCSGGSPEQTDLKALFDQGLLQVAVVSRCKPQPSSVTGGVQGWFDQGFQLVTAGDAAALTAH